MTKHILFATAGALALALAGCGDAEEEPPMEDTAAADQTSVAADDAAAQPQTAQQFVDAVAGSDMYEIEASRLAQENGTSEGVKTFAQMMIDDHTNSSTKLRDAAAQASGVTVNPRMTPKQQQDLQALRDAGENFDQTYAQQQVAAHEATLALLQGYAANGDDEALKAFAQETSAVVEGHLTQARELP
jgi:putative membrane protein